MADDPDNTRVRAALEELLRWDDLRRSPRLAEFLRYIVEATLAGDEANIKAYAIAVDVFRRPADFDPQTDPIVRVQGGRLRGLLNRFYDAGLNTVPVRIRIPVGRYVPEFEDYPPASGSGDRLAEAETAGPPGRRRRARSRPDASGPGGTGLSAMRQRLTLLAALIALGVILAWIGASVWMPLNERSGGADSTVPIEPGISIGSFTNLTGIASLDAPMRGLGLQLITDLSRFAELRVHGSAPDADEAAAANRGRREYELSGVVRRGATGIEFNMLLTDRASGEIVWTNSMPEPSVAVDYQLLIGRISRLTAGALGSQRSPIHAEQRQWVVQHGDDLPAVSEYICRLAHGVARDEPSRENREAARRCFERMLDLNMTPVIARAGLAGADALDAYSEAPPDEPRDAVLADALREARAAAEAVPYSSFVRGQLARVLGFAGNHAEAREEYVAAVERNPADSDLRGEFALMLALAGAWEEGEAQMTLALASAPAPPSWFYLLGTMADLREGDFAAAYASAQSLVAGSDQWGKVLAVVAAALSGHQAMVDELRPQLLENEHYQAYGILPWIKRDVRDAAVIEALAGGLTLAGLPEKIIYGAR